MCIQYIHINQEEYGMEQVTVRPWGNSQGIRMPKTILDKLNIHSSDTLQIEVVDETIVLRKTFKHKTFEERLAEYDGEISVCDFEWGEPVGRELL